MENMKRKFLVIHLLVLMCGIANAVKLDSFWNYTNDKIVIAEYIAPTYESLLILSPCINSESKVSLDGYPERLSVVHMNNSICPLVKPGNAIYPRGTDVAAIFSITTNDLSQSLISLSADVVTNPPAVNPNTVLYAFCSDLTNIHVKYNNYIESTAYEYLPNTDTCTFLLSDESRAK